MLILVFGPVLPNGKGIILDHSGIFTKTNQERLFVYFLRDENIPVLSYGNGTYFIL